MYIKKLFFPGEFDEAYIYMQKLVLFDAEGNLFMANLDQVARYLEERYDASVKSMPTHLFARNDWLTNEHSTSIFSNTFIRNAFLDALARFPDEINMDSSRFIRKVGNSGIIDLLDVTIYSERVYMGSDNGTFHLNVHWKKDEIELIEEPKKRHDAMCTQVNAKYGSINISCGDDGLFTRFDDFGWLGSLDSDTSEWQEVSDKSLRTSWLYENLLNYTTPTQPVLLKVQRSDQAMRVSERETREKVAIGFEGAPTGLSYLLGGQTEGQAFSPDSLIFLHNTSTAFLAQTHDRILFEIPIKHTRDEVNLVASKPRHLSSDLSTRVLDVMMVRRNLVLELYDSVWLLANNKLYKVVDGEALSIKAFPFSRYFKFLITIVVEEGVYIVFLFNENEIT